MEPLAMADRSARAPRYLSRFRCLGPECEDHCCAGWQAVDVDRETYEQLQREAPAEICRHLERNGNADAGPDEWALIAVPTDWHCPLFTDDRLCDIQRKLGEEFLPVTCDTFPRQAMLVDERLELAGRLSCPEIARLALLAPDGMEVEAVEPDRRLIERGALWIEQPWDAKLPATDPRRRYHQVRDRIDELLRRRDAALERRVAALGIALGRLDGWDELSADEVDQAFEQAQPELERRAAESSAEPHPLLVERLATWVRMGRLPARYRRCLDRVRDGLGIGADDRQIPRRTLRAGYAAGRQRLRRYVEHSPHVLENWLRAVALLGNFPYHPERGFFQEWAIFALRYGLVRVQLIGAAAAEGELTDDLVVETVQAFDKYVDGDEYWRRTLGLLERNGVLSREGIATMVGG
jgi:lysine-N-methylase